MSKTKPGKVYRVAKKRLFTRKEYMKGVPNPKITIFDMGDIINPDKFEISLSLHTKEEVQITHNALEAARIAANKYMTKIAGRSGFYLKFRVFPHVVLRENKLATGAGADRVSDGMRGSFGKNVGLAAHVKKNQKVVTINVNRNNYWAAVKALRKAGMKIPGPFSISIDRGRELLNL